MVNSYCFHAVYRLVDSWQEIGEYRQLTLGREHSYEPSSDWDLEGEQVGKDHLLGDHAARR